MIFFIIYKNIKSTFTFIYMNISGFFNTSYNFFDNIAQFLDEK